MAGAVLVRDLTELGIARRVFGEGLGELHVYTLYPQQYLELRRQGICPHILSQHISAPEAHQIYRRAFDDITEIVEAFPGAEGALSVNLGRYFKYHYWEYLTEVYALDLTLNRIISTLNGGTLTYLQRHCPVPTTHAGLVAAHSISIHVLQALHEEQPSVVKPLPHYVVPQAASQQTFWRAALPLLRPLRRVAKAAVLGAKALASPSTSSMPGGARAIAFGDGYDALIVIPDALRLAEESGCKPLWMTEWVDKTTTRSGLLYRKEYDQVERFSVDRYLAARLALRPSRAETKGADELLAQMMEGLNQLEVLRRYGLTKTMFGLRRDFRQALWRTRVMDRVLSHFAGSTIVITNYNGIGERAIEQVAPRHHIEVVARGHGLAGNIEAFEYRANRYLVSGELSRRLVKTFYGEDKPTYASPDPGLIRVADEWLGKGAEERAVLVGQRRAALSIEARHVILLMTTAARGRILNEFDYPQLEGLWLKVFEYLRVHPDVHLVVKSHKFNFDGWVKASASQQAVTNLTVLGGRLEDAVALADLVVDLGKPGTATLVALLFRKPTLLYRGLYKYVRGLGGPIHDAGASFLVDNPEALIRQWEVWRRDGQAYLDDLAARNRVLLYSLAGLDDVDEPLSHERMSFKPEGEA